MSEARINKKDTNQHIQVFVRVRPSNSAERAAKSTVSVKSDKEIVVHERPQDKSTKKFTFNRVFGPESKQVNVYNAVVSPLLEEVLAGYNCTVFAYGQTGTGKTFTMEGAGNDPSLHWQSDSPAGIIPRSLSHLFEKLRTSNAQEYSVRVSFLELYNEELFDLLSPTDDASKIRLYVNGSRKGAVIIDGLEEVTVHNETEVYKILEKGSEKRQTAATLMNANSSRSHTVFSIKVQIKENTVDGEELVKIGKLNLVDLAGSENAGRSGAVDGRAREAANINQSLLTLGRVIIALVERAPHIPYRESKLTRLLQESLGGRTKTSIIATVSPDSINLEETLSTLDYAHRAKNITNRPEINQKLSKKALLKEYTEEIERLRQDLRATRERNGVYLAQENYEEMQTTIEAQRKDIQEKINHFKVLEETIANKEKIISDLQIELEQKTMVLTETNDQLESTKNVLALTKSCLETTKFDRDVHTHLVEKHAKTERILYSQAQTLLKVADTATDDTYKLHEKILRKKRVEDENENLGQQFRQNTAKDFGELENNVSTYSQNLVQFCSSMTDQLLTHAAVNSRVTDTTIQLAKDLDRDARAETEVLKQTVNASYDEYKKWIEAQVNEASGMTEQLASILMETAASFALRMQQVCETENEIAENLRLVNKQTARKLENLMVYTQDFMATHSEKLQASHDKISQRMANMQEIIGSLERKENGTVKDINGFSEAFEGLFTHYKSLCAKMESSNSDKMDLLRTAEQVISNISKETADSHTNELRIEKSVEREILSSVNTIKIDVAADMEKNWTIADDSVRKNKVMVNDCETAINSNCENFNTSKNLVQRNAQSMLERADTVRASIVSSTDRLQKIVSDASVNHVELAEQQRHKAESASSELARNCERQGVESTEWNNRITEQLSTTHQRVEIFLAEDMRRDVPTGLTPAKRKFEYPRELTTTSPPERIIKRFRAARKQAEDSEDEQDLTLICAETPLKRQFGSPKNRTSTPASITKSRSTSTPITDSKENSFNCDRSNHTLSKSASTSDLSFIARSSCDSSTRSEFDMHVSNNNKENGEEEFVKPVRKFRTKPKVRPTSRRVLGSHN